MNEIEIPIGGTIRLNDGTLLQSKQTSEYCEYDGVCKSICSGCFLDNYNNFIHTDSICNELKCESTKRFDNKNVIFVKLEEGEK